MNPVPGPSEVTYGQNVAFTATLHNSEKSMFVDVRLSVPVPQTFVDGDPRPARFRSTSCEDFQLLPDAESPEELVCNWGRQLRAGDTAAVTIVWQTPTAGSSSDCGSTEPTPTPSPCMATQGTWVIKEGSQAKGGGADTFETNLAGVAFIAGDDTKTRARGFAIDACSDPSSSSETVSTDAVGPGNRLSTTVCPSTVPQGGGSGLVIQIDETTTGPDNPGLTDTVSICIPDPSSSCSAPSPVPWEFAPRATFDFVIDNKTLPPGKKITKVFHDGLEDAIDADFDCSITIVNRTKTTMVSCESKFNGRWDFG